MTNSVLFTVLPFAFDTSLRELTKMRSVRENSFVTPGTCVRNATQDVDKKRQQHTT
jgi:hypothetical protein